MKTTEVLTFLKETSEGLQKVRREIARYLKLEQATPQPSAILQNTLTSIGAKLNKLSSCDQVNGMVRTWIETQTRSLEQLHTTQKAEFGRQLNAELEQLGLKLAKSGDDLKCGIFLLETFFDDGKCSIWLGPKQEKLKDTQLDPLKIGKELLSLKRELELKIDPKGFLKLLKESVAQVGEQHNGKDAPIVEVLGAVAFAVQPARFRSDPRKENFQEFGRAHLSYALFQLRESDARADFLSSLALVTAPRDKTRSRKDFLWVLEKENGEGSAYSAFSMKH